MLAGLNVNGQEKEERRDSLQLVQFDYPCIDRMVIVDFSEIEVTPKDICGGGFDIPLTITSLSKRPLRIHAGFMAYHDGVIEPFDRGISLEPGAKATIPIRYHPSPKYIAMVKKRQQFKVPVNGRGHFHIYTDGYLKDPYDSEYTIQLAGTVKVVYPTSEAKQLDSIELFQFNYPCFNHQVNIDLGIWNLTSADILKGEVEVPFTIKNISTKALSVPVGLTAFSYRVLETSKRSMMLKPGRTVTIPIRCFFSRAWYMARLGKETQISNTLQLKGGFTTGEGRPRETLYQVSVIGKLKAIYDTNRKGISTVVSAWEHQKKADSTALLQFNYPCIDNVLYIDVGELEFSLSEHYPKEFDVPIVIENVSGKQISVPGALLVYHDNNISASGPVVQLQPGGKHTVLLHYCGRNYPDKLDETEVYHFGVNKDGRFNILPEGRPPIEYKIRLNGRCKVVY
jgi:hypothetical protein